MSDLKGLIDKINKFRDERDWNQFHNPKDMAISLALESAEVLEHFQWKSLEEMNEYIRTNKEEIGEELADVLYWVLLMSHDLGIDILDASVKKIAKSEEKYPIDKARGKHIKYNKL